MGTEERSRMGLEIRQQSVPDFWKFARFFERLNLEQDRSLVRRSIVAALYEYCERKIPADFTEEDMEADYERYKTCIGNAGRGCKTFINEIAVTDMEQRMRPHPLVSGVRDPAKLIDIMLFTPEQRLRFEARRALHLGAQFFEFEKYFGTQENLEETLNDIVIFFTGIFSISQHDINTRIYHKLEAFGSQDEWSHVSELRVPHLDRTDDRRRPGENYSAVAINTMNVPGIDTSPAAHVILESRVKDPFSATLKSIRKDVPIRNLHDCLGLTLYEQPHDSKDSRVFDNIVETIQRVLPWERGDHQIHHSRAAQPKSLWQSSEKNEFSGSNFSMEKIIVHWKSSILSAHHDMISGVLPFGSLRNIEDFWDRVNSLQKDSIDCEIQIGDYKNFINNGHVPSEENHGVYKALQATGLRRSGENRDRNVLGILFPRDIYGINFNDRGILEAMIEKQRSKFGIHHRALEK